MMFLDTPPPVIETRVFTRMPDAFRLAVRSAWGDANKGGHPVDGFIEGPAFDDAGNLYVVDIPHGRVFRIAPDGGWSLVVRYDGEPNGLKFHPDGRILIADYRNGLVELDPVNGRISPFLPRRNSEAFKGCNDLAITADGDVFFTDQGQTGLHDPTGRVYHLSPQHRLDCLLSNGPSPNGLVHNRADNALYVAMTRDNAVWRLPFAARGGVAKVGRFCTMFGRSGPDGLALDEAGNLLVAHASLGQVFVFGPDGACIARVKSCAGPACTNLAFGGPDRRRLYITESATGSILVADMPAPGAVLPSR